MIELPTVDLLAMDGIDGNRNVRALLRTVKGIKFRRVIFMAPNFPEELSGIVDEYHPFSGDYETWNRFMIKELARFIPSGHVLFIHHDGYVLNPAAWRSSFLRYDYIGAPWWYAEGLNVGNGGFSLRSRKFIEISAKFSFPKYAPEDHVLIRVNGAIMQEQGVVFAPEIIASKFALEGNSRWGHTWSGQFGFHNEGITDISRSSQYD